jgi:hypothetical protein
MISVELPTQGFRNFGIIKKHFNLYYFLFLNNIKSQHKDVFKIKFKGYSGIF